jgi:hypothetical protein
VRYCEVFSTSVVFDGGYVKVLGFSSTSVVFGWRIRGGIDCLTD